MVADTAFQKVFRHCSKSIQIGYRQAGDVKTKLYADGLHWQDQKDDESMFECSFCWVKVN